MNDPEFFLGLFMWPNFHGHFTKLLEPANEKFIQRGVQESPLRFSEASIRTPTFSRCLGKCYCGMVVALAICVFWDFCEQTWAHALCSSLFLCLKTVFCEACVSVLGSWAECRGSPPACILPLEAVSRLAGILQLGAGMDPDWLEPVSEVLFFSPWHWDKGRSDLRPCLCFVGMACYETVNSVVSIFD